jgi:hypothetical protein
MATVRHLPGRLRLRLIGTSPTAGTASKPGPARSPSSSRPWRREAPLPLDRERSGATEDTVLGIVKRIGEPGQPGTSG